jgi:hypothetical protein
VQDRFELCEPAERRVDVPPKIRELIANLQAAGFVDRGAKAVIETSFTRKFQTGNNIGGGGDQSKK